MPRKLLGAFVGVAVLIVPGVAHAEVVRGPEPVGDHIAWQLDAEDPWCTAPVPTTAPSAAAAFDLTGMSVRHKPHRLVVTTRFAAGIVDRQVSLAIRTPRRVWISDVTIRDASPVHPDVWPEPEWTEEEWDTDDDGISDCSVWVGISAAPDCRGAVARSTDADTAVQVVIPRRCIGNPTWVQVGAGTYGALAEDPTVRYMDAWDPSAPDSPEVVTDYDPSFHVWGPRVLAGPGADVAPAVEAGVERRTVTRTAYGSLLR